MKANRRFKFSCEEGAQIGVGTLIIFIAMILVAAVASALLIKSTGILEQRAQETSEEATREVSSNLRVDGLAGERAKYTTIYVNGSSASNTAVTITKGGMIEWINNATNPDSATITPGTGMWSGNKTVGPGEFYEYRFDSPGTYTYTVGSTSCNVTVGGELDYNNIVKVRLTVSLGPGSENIDLSQLVIYTSDGDHVAYLYYNISDNTATSTTYALDALRIRGDSEFDPTQPVLQSGDMYNIIIDYRRAFGEGTGDDTYMGIEPRTEMELRIRPEAGATVIYNFRAPGAYYDKKYITLRM